MESNGLPPVAPAVPDAEATDSVPAGVGRPRFRCVTGEEDGAPPVPGAVVTVYRRGFEDWVEVGRAVADEDGWARFGGLPVGDGFLSQLEGIARAEGRAGVWFSILPPALAEVLPQGNVVVLPRPRLLSGRVLDAMTGRPVAGARVETRDWGGHVEVSYRYDLTPGPLLDRAETGADGTFQLPSRVKLMQVTAEGYATARKSVGSSEEEVTIRLSPGAELAGRVTDKEGRPAAGATVLACPAWASTHRERPPTKWRYAEPRKWRDAGGGFDLFTADRSKTDADGRYRMTGLMAREEHFVWVLLDGKPRTRLTVVRPDGQPCDLRFVRLATLRVRSARPDRKGVLVTLTPRGDPGWEFSAGSDMGEAVNVVRIIPGIYDVCVVPRRYRNRSFVVTLGPGENAVRDLAAGPGEEPRPRKMVTLCGVVVDDRGVPVVEAWASCEGAAVLDKLTDAGGRFWFRKPVDTYPELAAEAEGHETVRASGWEYDGSGPIRLVLPRVVPIRIPLRWAASATAPKLAEVRVTHPGGASSYRYEVEEGWLSLPMRADATAIRVEPEGFLPFDVPMPEGEEREVAPVTLSTGLAIRFRVVDREGRGIPVSTVDVVQRGGHHYRTAISDFGGYATVTGLFGGESARAIAFARGYAVDARDGLMPGGGTVVTFRLSGRVRLMGRVVYDDGFPAGAVRVTAYRSIEGREVDHAGSVHTDNAGRFVIALPPGEWRLDFEPPTGSRWPESWTRRVTLHHGKENAETFVIPRSR